MPGDNQRPRCNRCEHYWITFDAHFRYGCRAMGFKSRQLPERDVVESSAALPAVLGKEAMQLYIEAQRCSLGKAA